MRYRFVPIFVSKSEVRVIGINFRVHFPDSLGQHDAWHRHGIWHGIRHVAVGGESSLSLPGAGAGLADGPALCVVPDSGV
jgi:hypothetical protein